jgi:hypothetical protein
MQSCGTHHTSNLVSFPEVRMRTNISRSHFQFKPNLFTTVDAGGEKITADDRHGVGFHVTPAVNGPI